MRRAYSFLMTVVEARSAGVCSGKGVHHCSLAVPSHLGCVQRVAGWPTHGVPFERPAWGRGKTYMAYQACEAVRSPAWE